MWDACKTVGEMCNLLAMTYLQQEEFSMVSRPRVLADCGLLFVELLRGCRLAALTSAGWPPRVCDVRAEQVLELLKKAEILTERDDAGRAVTYNNFACYYRRCVRGVPVRMFACACVVMCLCLWAIVCVCACVWLC